MKNLIEEIDYVRAIRNIGNIYIEKGQPQEAIKEWMECEEGFRSLDNRIELSALSIDLGRAFLQLLNDSQSLRYLNEGLIIADSLNNGKLRIHALNALATFYHKQKDYKKAHLFSQQSAQLQDSIANLAREALVYKSNLEQKRRENAVLAKSRAQLEMEKAELKTKSLFQTGMLIFCGLVLIVFLTGGYAFLNKVKKQKAWEKVDTLLQEQELKMAYARLEGKTVERERIAKDLHDGLGGMLATVKLYFAPIEKKLVEMQQESQQHYDKAIALLDESCEEVRRISHDMISNSLKDYGLKYVLEEMCEQIQDSQELDVSVSIHGMDTRLDSSMELKIYRIAQELVGNILKHAKAKTIDIQLNKFDDVINIMVEDDGIGFDKRSMFLKKKGVGLTNVAGRVKELNGTWNIDSTQGRGTSVSVDIPI